MANPFNKLRLKSAAPNSQHFDLSSNHLTTTDFGQLQPSYYRELYIGDKFKIRMDSTAFTAPLVVPPMGICHLKSRAFFVPYRLVWRYFNDFYSNKQVNRAGTLYTLHVPFFTQNDIVSAFLNFSHRIDGSLSLSLLSPVSGDVDVVRNADININGDNVTAYNFTPLGRMVYKFLRSLGYSWNWVLNDIYYQSNDFSVLPILCVFRAYLDYYVPSAYIQEHPINNFLSTLINETDDGTQPIDVDMMLYCITQMFISYPDDYYTSAWLTPNQPTDDAHLNESLFPRTNSIGYIADLRNDETLAIPVNGSVAPGISAYALRLVKAADSWFKRNNFAGAARVSDALLANFGIRPADSQLDRAEFLGYDDTVIKWQMITNTSSSDGAELGAFGAKGYAEGNGTEFNFEAKEIGLFFILSSLQPDAVYYHGADKTTMQLNWLDFYQPSFEKLGVSPIKVAEVYSDANFSLNGNSQPRNVSSMENLGLEPNRVYGFAPNYASHKVPHDLITGDFNIPTLGSELSSWHFGREFNFNYGDVSPEPHGNFTMNPMNLRYMNNYTSQYNRIFNVQDNSANHFIIVFSFNVDAYRPMLSISDSIPIEGDGETVEMQPDGTHFD